MFHIPSSEVERKHGSHEQGSLTLHTSLGLVEKTGAHRLTWEKEETETCTYNYHSQTHRGGQYFGLGFGIYTISNGLLGI